MTRFASAIAAGKRICVHGDYDADGICATALAVTVLRSLGANVDWHLPSRFEEGYGVSIDTLARLAREECGLVITVDCGITAVTEVAEARALGLEVVVTDHHRPGDELPDCPVVATRPSGYPFPELCGTGVVYKLAEALVGAEKLEEHLDLVALATVADVVPLLDENRWLVAAGLRRLARTTKPGLRALMQAAGVDPAALDAGSVGFRLAPRLNAAGRLCHPGVALDLLLTGDEQEAQRLAGELETLNRDRQAVEDRILRDAVRQVGEWPESTRRRSAYVIAGQEWHRGVIGIVASRLVERFSRPVVLVAGTEDCMGRLRAIDPRLRPSRRVCVLRVAPRALGWSPRRGRALDPSGERGRVRRSLRCVRRGEAYRVGAHASDHDRRRRRRTGPDARALRGTGASRSVRARQPRHDAPRGRMRALGARSRGGGEAPEARSDGQRDEVRRDRIRSGREARSLPRPGPYDVAFRLGANRWNGSVSPQLVVRKIFDTPERFVELRAWLAAEWRKPAGERDARAAEVFAELGLDEAGARWRPLVESEAFMVLLEETLAAAA